MAPLCVPPPPHSEPILNVRAQVMVMNNSGNGPNLLFDRFHSLCFRCAMYAALLSKSKLREEHR